MCKHFFRAILSLFWLPATFLLPNDIFLIAAIWSYLINAAVLHCPTQANIAHLQILWPNDMTTARGRRTLPSLPALVREPVRQWSCAYSKTVNVTRRICGKKFSRCPTEQYINLKWSVLVRVKAVLNYRCIDHKSLRDKKTLSSLYYCQEKSHTFTIFPWWYGTVWRFTVIESLKTGTTTSASHSHLLTYH